MESGGNVPEALAAMERAEVAPFVDYPPTPRWYPAAAGAWFAALVVTMRLLSTIAALGIPLIVALLVAEGAFLGWYRSRRGTMPRLRNAPREIRAEMIRYTIVAAVILTALFAVTLIASPSWTATLIAAPVMFVVVTVGLTIYERRYAAAAAAVRTRLAPDQAGGR